MIDFDDSGKADGTTAYSIATAFWTTGYGACNLAVALPDDALRAYRGRQEPQFGMSDNGARNHRDDVWRMAEHDEYGPNRCERGSAVVTGTETTTRTITSVDVPANAPIYIFCENNYNSTTGASAPYRYQPMRLYSFKIYEDEGGVDVLKRDFIPCIDTNGAYGLWDAVEGTFHGNQASGADFAGGVIYAAEANEKKTVPSASGLMELRGGDAATSEIEVGSVATGSLVYVANGLKAVTLGKRLSMSSAANCMSWSRTAGPGSAMSRLRAA